MKPAVSLLFALLVLALSPAAALAQSADGALKLRMSEVELGASR
jgi:hypothetical protein